MTLSAPHTSTQIHRRIQRLGRGAVFVPGDFLGLGDRGAVDISLHRLTKAGHIRRLARGVYDFPRMHAGLGPLTPSVNAVADAIARSTGETIVCSDATAANRLGVTAQVPAQTVLLTDGTTRPVRAGGQTIQFKRVSPSRLAGGDTPAGLVLRALRFLGADAIDDDVVSRLRSALSDRDRKKLSDLRRHALSWMLPVIGRILTPEDERDRQQALAS
ncbi:MAG: hypothetical protein H6716_22810 [Polyangiaceae bacterium]|nr:hypothetical protein [Polyangiaceae bacterium]